ncbi:MAG: GYD domain-containing protein [Candidatus Binatia bacterium]
MPTYIVLVNFTEQGIRNVKQTTERAKVLSGAASRLGIKIKETYWTMGAYDAALIADAPDDDSITALALSAGSLGNIRTQTMRAYSADEMSKILSKLP